MQVKNIVTKNIHGLVPPVKMQWEKGFVKTQKAFDLFDEKLGNLHISIDKKFDETGLNEKVFLNIFNDSEKVPIVQEIIEFFRNKNILGHNIEVLEKYREKHYGLGELMRLLSIAQMNENGSETFKLYSKNTAIGFHAKYKFHPHISNPDIIEAFLKKISYEKTPGLKDLSNSAKIFEEENWTNISYTSEWINRVNSLIYSYLNKMLKVKQPSNKQYSEIPFIIDMELTRNELLQNRNFYNSLFEKRGIDYKI